MLGLQCRQVDRDGRVTHRLVRRLLLVTARRLVDDDEHHARVGPQPGDELPRLQVHVLAVVHSEHDVLVDGHHLGQDRKRLISYNNNIM